jgi:hypothetical protein
MSEEPEGGAAVAVNKAKEIGAFVIELPGALRFEAEEFADSQRAFRPSEIF